MANQPSVRRRKSAWCAEHEGNASWTVDLIWDVFHENKDNHRIYEILAGEERGLVPWDMSLFNEECGTAIEMVFKKYFGEGKYDLTYFPYYKEPMKAKLVKLGPNQERKYAREDLKYDRGKIAAGAKKIRVLLDNKIPVRVPLIHGEVFTIRYNKVYPQHYVGVVGYKENVFLYLDPAIMPPYSLVRGYVRPVSIQLGTLVHDVEKGLIRGGMGRIAPRAHVLGGPLYDPR